MPPSDKSPDDPEALRARLTALQAEIRARAPAPQQQKQGGNLRSAEWLRGEMSMACAPAASSSPRSSSAAPSAGAGLARCTPSPCSQSLFFLLGVVAGVLNVIRATSPKGGKFVRDFRLSGKGAEDKDVPRVSPRGGERRRGIATWLAKRDRRSIRSSSFLCRMSSTFACRAYDVSITNSAIYMIIAVGGVLADVLTARGHDRHPRPPAGEAKWPTSSSRAWCARRPANTRCASSRWCSASSCSC